MTAPVLVCTVGGSAQPIISAIRAAAPAFVLFLVTPDSTNRDGKPQPGSFRQLEGPESIPALTGLDPTRFHRRLVPPDQPDIAFAAVSESLRALRARFPGTPLIADYTGGTKSMSAALLAATLGIPGVTLQIMAGDRLDLVRVADGTERPFPIVPDFLLIERQAALLRAAWKTYGYAEAADGFKDLEKRLAARPDAPLDLARRIADLATLSEAFAAWDRFDHAAARELLRALPPAVAVWVGPWRRALDLLLDDKTKQAARLLDLWRNAERRATRGQYDDAVARCYRLIEATAQYLLGAHCHLNTSDLDLASIPEEARTRAKLTADNQGKVQASLGQAWTLLDSLMHAHPAPQLMRRKNPDDPGHTHRQTRFDLLQTRNYSILAHGWDPIGRAGWDAFKAWLELHFIPQALVPEIQSLVPGAEILQLPSEPPADL